MSSLVAEGFGGWGKVGEEFDGVDTIDPKDPNYDDDAHAEKLKDRYEQEPPTSSLLTSLRNVLLTPVSLHSSSVDGSFQTSIRLKVCARRHATLLIVRHGRHWSSFHPRRWCHPCKLALTCFFLSVLLVDARLRSTPRALSFHKASRTHSAVSPALLCNGGIKEFLHSHLAVGCKQAHPEDVRTSRPLCLRPICCCPAFRS